MTRVRSLCSRLLASFIQHARLCVALAAVFGAWPAHADGGTITGTVTSAATGTPIASVTVYIYTSAGNYVGSTSTNAEGVYSWTNLTSGGYFVKTWNSLGFVDELHADIPCSGGSCPGVLTGTAVNVTAGLTTSGIDFSLIVGGTITGTVTNATTGALLANVQLTLYMPDGRSVGNVWTDASGVFTKTGLTTGTYYLRTYASTSGYIDEVYSNIPCPGGSCPSVFTGTAVSVTAGSMTSGIDIGLTPGGTITGTVTAAATGSPLYNIGVTIYGSTGTTVANVWTNASGVFTKSGLSTGTYYLRTSGPLHVHEIYDNITIASGSSPSVTTGTPVSVTAGATTSGIDFALPTGGAISGTVTDEVSGAPLASVSVYAYTAAGNSAGSGATDASGAYTIWGLTTGTYYLRTYNSVGYADELYADGPCPFFSCGVGAGLGVGVVIGATTSGINIQLGVGGTITGTVTDATTGAPLAGKNVRIYLSSNTSYYQQVTTNASGVYTLGGLAEGTYYVATSIPTDPVYLDALYAGTTCVQTCVVTTGTPVSVTKGATTANIDLPLVQGGAVSGTVTDAGTAAALANVPVTVHSSAGVSVRTANTNASGQYSVGPVPPGTYYVRTVTTQNYVNELYADVACPSCGTTTSSSITVPGGASTVLVSGGATTPAIDFGLTSGGTITGTVTDAVSSAVLAGVTVTFYTSDGTAIGTATTNASGVYTKTGLSAGSYYVRFTTLDMHYGEVYNNLPVWTTVTSGTAAIVASGATTTVNAALEPASPSNSASALELPIGVTENLVTVNPEIGTAGDWYKFFVPPGAAGQDLRVNLRVTSPYPVPAPANWRSDLDFELLDGSQAVRGIAISGSDNETIYLHAVASGWYYINVIYATTDYADAPIARYTATIETATDFGLGYLTGRVVDDQGQGVEQAYVSVYDVPYVQTNSFQTITTGPGGVFSIAATPGSHNLYLSGLAYSPTQGEINILTEYYADKATLATADPVVVTAGATAALGDWVASRGAIITGHVTNGAGSPLVSATVIAYNAAGSSYASAYTDAAGNYTLMRVPVDGAKLRFSRSTYAQEYYDDQPSLGAAVVLPTQPGVTISDVNATLTAGGTISGNVRNFQWNGLAATVYLYSVLDGTVSRTSAKASTNGSFSLTYVKAGDYRVFATMQGYAAKWYGNAGTFDTGQTVTVTEGQTTYAVNIVLGRSNGGDLSGDGKGDILWHHATRGEVWTWPMNGAASTAQSYVGTVGEPGWEIRGVSDFTGDGKADLVWRNSLTGMLYLWTMNGATVTAETYVDTVDPSYDIVSTGDYNGDGKADLLWRQPTNGEVWVWLMNGPTVVSQTYIDTVDPAYVVQGSGDLNGDGKADLVWRHATGGDVWVWLMNGATPTVAYVETVAELDYTIVGVGDHTGDGKADLLWHHATRGEVWIWPMNGATVVSQSYVDTVPETTYRIVGNGDYNGDGKADILWHHATRGEVWVWLMNGTTKQSETYVDTVPEVEYQIVRRR